NNSATTYTSFISSFSNDSEDHKILQTIGELVSYCDLNAANKSELNEYDDKRTIARSFVRQTDWVKNLLNYKIANNNPEVLTDSVRNAILYLKNPTVQFTVLSENHRTMLSRYLLKDRDYDRTSFPGRLISYF